MPPPSSRPAPEVAELVRMSRAVGRDTNLVQGGGGNTSVKAADGETMVVKASGTPLGRMTAARGYRRVRLAPVRDLLNDRSLDRVALDERERAILERLMASAVDGLPGRPSVETALHAVLGRAVCHTHPSAGSAVCCAVNGKDLADEWFSGLAGPPLFIPYVEPGMALARKVQNASKRHAKQHGAPPRMIFLGNHGVFVSAEAGDEAVGISRQVDAIARCQWLEARPKGTGPHALAEAPPDRLRRRISAAMKRVWAALPDGDGAAAVAYSAGEAVRAALAHPDAERLAKVPPLSPEHVVFAHGQPLWIAPDSAGGDWDAAFAQAIERARRTLPRAPVAALVSGTGLFAVGPDAKAARTALSITEASLLTLLAADAFGGCKGLSPADIKRLEEWEAEAFRRKVMAGKGG